MSIKTTHHHRHPMCLSFFSLLVFTLFFPLRANAVTINEFTIPTANSNPIEITAGSDGNLWFTEYHDRIGRITPAGIITEFSTGITSGSSPISITAGPDGNSPREELIE